ncbi:MAG: hypothetical protein J3K34DRAFT_463785 [Monoraphidium minutum]|nr:MAG: hypothetical protein J3K34DRAFT_463785 [Monoraphidium minutum]
MGLMSAITKVYPKAMWPSKQKVMGLSAWGGVVGAVLLYTVQPWDYAKSLMTKEEEASH